MTSLREAAQIAWEKRERQRKADQIEHEQRMCSKAVRDAYCDFADTNGGRWHADSATYNQTAKRVELGFNSGDVKIARVYQGAASWEWRVLHQCPDCGALVAGQLVNDLADIGRALAEGPEGLDDHYCAPREDRQMSEPMDVEVEA